MLIYKNNLSILNSKYGDLERRIIELFARDPYREDIWILDNMEILIMYLLEDGLIEPTGVAEDIKAGSLSKKQFRLTDRGREFISRRHPPENPDPSADQ